MDLAANLESIRLRIKAACDRCDREPNCLTLLAVTKTRSPDVVSAAANLGLLTFGENKVQEAKAKIPLCPGKLRWHFIGHLQSNKCRDAVQLFQMIQSVDSLSLAQEINKRAPEAAKTMPGLLEVNLVGEASKFGFGPKPLIAEVNEINTLSRLKIHGMMNVPPWTLDAEASNPHLR